MLNNLRGWQLKTYARVELKTGSSTYSITNVLCKIVMKQFCCVVENSMEMKQNREENDIIAEAFLFMCVVFWWHWNSHMWRYAEKRTFFGCFHFISALTIPFFVVCFHRKKQQQQQQIWLKTCSSKYHQTSWRWVDRFPTLTTAAVLVWISNKKYAQFQRGNFS